MTEIEKKEQSGGDNVLLDCTITWIESIDEFTWMMGLMIINLTVMNLMIC